MRLPHSPLAEDTVEIDADALDILRYRYFKKKMDRVLEALDSLPPFAVVDQSGDYVDASMTAMLMKETK